MSAAAPPRAGSVPRVYSAILAITAELAATGIAKARTNQDEHYLYRSIDDVTKQLAPLLAKHRLCILPRVTQRTVQDCSAPGGALLASVTVRAAFDFVSARDGSCHTVEAYGEALDGGDKGTAKAMTAAFKQAVLQTFCVPAEPGCDPDAITPRRAASSSPADPVQGWDQWSRDIQEMIRVCETGEALARLQTAYRTLLREASKRRPDVFAAIGAALKARRAELKPPAPPAAPASAAALLPSPAKRSARSTGLSRAAKLQQALHA